MRITPLGDRVIVRKDPPIERTQYPEGKIIIPVTTNEMGIPGTVLAVGLGRIIDLTGEKIPIPLKSGDRILFHRQAGVLINPALLGMVSDEPGDILVMDQTAIMAKFTEDPPVN